ncbi:hypothetical protein [Streptomyces phage Psst1]|nr:hypothetical protein [Streptomyces phage Psst1]WPJ30681.1 hypothetical protein [Streptomyces phage Psst2]
MNILTFIMVVWLIVVAIAWCLDNGTEIVAEWKAAKQKRMAEEKTEQAKNALTVARLNEVRMDIRHNRHGAHRLTKVS